MIVYDEEHEGTPLIFGVLRKIHRLEPYLRKRVKIGIEEFPEVIDKIEKLTYTNVVVIPLAQLKTEGENITDIRRDVTYVPFPGSKVYKIKDGDLISKLLLKTIKNGRKPIVLGNHKYSEKIEIPLDPSYIQYHIGVFAATGLGKSRLVKVLIDEIIEKTEYAAIVFDHTGMDYAPFYPDSTIRSYEIELDPMGIADFFLKKLRLNPQYYSTYMEAFAIELKKHLEKFRRELQSNQNDSQILKQIRSEMTDILKRTAGKLGAKFETQRNLEERMKYFIDENILEKMLLHRKYTAHDIIKLAKEKKKDNKPLVIDLSFEETLEMKRSIVGNIIEAGWKWIFERNFSSLEKKYKPINLVIVIDEAQNYAWRSGYCQEQIERIAREGRKWKYSLIIVSQRLARSVDPDIRANINTVFFSKLNQTSDLREIQDFADITGIELSNLAQLVPREFYVAGLMNPLRKPIVIKVREVEEPVLQHG